MNEKTEHQESKTAKITRRSFMKGAAGLGLLAASASVLGSERAPTYRDYSQDATHFWTRDEDGEPEFVAADPVITLAEQGQLNNHVIDVETQGDRIFSSVDVPEQDAEFPVLVLYSPNHADQDIKKPTGNPLKDMFKRFKVWGRDVVTPDRTMFIFTRRTDLTPGVLSRTENDPSSPSRAFHPVRAETPERLLEIMKKDFPELKLADELLEKVAAGEIIGYWRNLGSSFTRGMLPDVYLVR